jgi:hypothetical protein
MNNYPSFAEYLGWRSALSAGDGGIPSDSSVCVGFDPLAERSLFRGLFKVVNPSRPASSLNSRLLAAPARKKRLGSQVMGR